MPENEMKFSQTYSTDMYHVGLLRVICDQTGMSKSEIINRLIEKEAARIEAIETQTQPTH